VALPVERATQVKGYTEVSGITQEIIYPYPNSEPYRGVSFPRYIWNHELALKGKYHQGHVGICMGGRWRSVVLEW
jgi:hypothetical protein